MTPARQTIATWFEANGRRGPSFDMIRLFAALMVMYSHSFMVTRSDDWLWPHITRQASPGRLAVAVFFVLSGYLVMSSFEADPRPLQFLRNRVLRVYPALITVLLATAFVLGPIFTTLPLSAYFAAKGTSAYLLSVIFPTKQVLPGVFELLPNTDVNGSLWSLRFELACYAGIALMGSYFLVRRGYLLALACAMTLLMNVLIFGAQHLRGGELLRQILLGGPMVACFLGGACVARFADVLAVNRWTVLGAAAVTALALKFGGLFLVFPFAGAYLVAVLGNSRLLAFPSRRKGIFAGDFSYGVYVIAFPVQQSVRYVLGDGCTWWRLMIVALPVVLVLAVLSWHFVEKPFLRLKHSGFGSLQRVA